MLLIHQLPPTPAYLRVKVGRQLARLGAVAIKNAVYALPRTDEAREDLQWILRELVKGGGDGSILEARFVGGLSDEGVVGLFQAAREADYRAVAAQARRLGGALPRRRGPPGKRGAELAGQVARCRRRLAEVVAIDFFEAPGREAAEASVAGLEARMRPGGSEDGRPPERAGLDRAEYQGRTWVTRAGVKVDRMASAWLIRRFIDPAATFRFVAARGHRPAAGELRFDMFEAEFTHDGERCTFEVLLERFGLASAALRAIAEIVHDIDLKDGRYGREETAGIAQVIAGIAAAHPGDQERLARGAALFEDLHALHGGAGRDPHTA